MTTNATSRSKKRKFKTTYDPSQEDFPDEPWYGLDHEHIAFKVVEMCNKLIISLRHYESIDQGIKDLVKDAEDAKKLPSIKECLLAILGEQGKGKSSLGNAVFDRKLLETSGGAEACTAFATIIVYKKGADDHTRHSDVKVEFWNEEEIGIRIREQIDRWTDVYPGSNPSQPQDIDQSSDSDGISDDGSATSDEPDKKKMQRAASTAKEFFEIIFDTKEDKESKRWLEEVLFTTNIRDSDFFNICHERANQRLARISTHIDTRNSLSEYKNISDKDLAKIRNLIKQIWPFVKVKTIATGHVLLRNGLVIFDLPGYGDTSQLRETVINTFRRQANYEMVVAPYSRLQTSTVQEYYIGRSIRKAGADKTILVMNRSDELLNENDASAMISQINEEPFISLTARLLEIDKIIDDDDNDEVDVHECMTQIIKEATVAYIKRETVKVQRQMSEKGIRVFSTSAFSYLLWINRLRSKDPILTVEESGIIELRQFLKGLPAEANFRAYQEHIENVVSAISKRGRLILEKHVEDKGYAKMRQDLKQQIPALEERLKDLVTSYLEAQLAKLWYRSEQRNANEGIRSMVLSQWIHAKIVYPGFAKMVRENGIPVNGKYFGRRNLNDDLLGPLKRYIEQWHSKMQLRAEPLVQRLYRHVQDLLAGIEVSTNSTSADPALKRRAIEALTDASQRIMRARDAMLVQLSNTLRENYLWFTTEIDIHSPVAREMKAVYESAEKVGWGRGSYNTKRKKILDSILPNSEDPRAKLLCPLVENLEAKLMERQKLLWGDCSGTFITEVVTQLNDFSRVTELLLMNAAYTTDEHKKARRLLRRLLADFDKSLEDIKCRFTNAAQQPPEKKIKREVPEDESDHRTASPAFGPETAIVPVEKYSGWFRFREASSGRPY